MHRPTGVTILAWLAIVWGVLSILVGVLGVLAGIYATAVGGVALNSGLVAGANSYTLGIETTVLSFLGTVVGLGDIVFGIGMLRLSRWAWILAHVVVAGSVVLGVLSAFVSPSRWVGSVLGIAIAAGVLYYLHRPVVLAAFGRGQSHLPPQPEAPTSPGAAG